ncbi:MAG: DUF937 domain-containing protein [Bacteroidales bacterium]|nr:DUF937 domain-containing protein [Bacteroidales bacterium]MBR6160802.1 DUF937 domain-containing protein [Bacteroidales bacterium]
MDLTSIINSLTGNNMIGEISKKFNIDTTKIVNVIKAAIPKFLGAMQKNAGTAAGASALVQALSSHAGQGMGINIEDGKKILSKIFGGNLGSVISGLSSQTSTTNDQVSNILASIAPNLLSILGKNHASAGSNIGNVLGSLLGGSSSSSTTSGAGKILGGLFGKLIKK